MEKDNIDKIVQKAFSERAIQPSNSAWERLEDQLEAVPKKTTRNWFLIAGYAASILLIVSVAFFINTDDEIPSIPSEIVLKPIDSSKFKKPNFKTIAPIKEAIVKNITIEETIVLKSSESVGKLKKKRLADTIHDTFEQPKKNKETRIASVEKVKINQKKIIKKDTKIKSTIVDKQPAVYRIKIDSDALLYAVTHTENEVKQYYAKYNVNRNEALKVVQKELQRFNLKIDAESMLAEVERNIDEASFKKNFMKILKGKASGFAVAFSNRNN